METPSAKVRARLKHPVIDADGHTVEITPVLLDYLQDYVRQIGGAGMAARLMANGEPTLRGQVGPRWSKMSPQERHDRRVPIPAANVPNRSTLDTVTPSLPRLLYERLDDMGLDFAVLYPSTGLSLPNLVEPELRQVVCRALNCYYADIYREFADRMTPAALIPMTTPAEAVEEVEFAVKSLKLKAIMIEVVSRPVPEVLKHNPKMTKAEMLYFASYGEYLDTFGLDSEHDYDPFWAKCVELGVAPTSHSGTSRFGTRRSLSNHVYNHIGHFAGSAEALCKSLFFGGVTRRFPALNFAFLECGVGWACNLYADIHGHWEKRKPELWKDTSPEEARRLFEEYGDDRMRAAVARHGDDFFKDRHGDALFRNYGPWPEVPDDWGRARVERAEDIRDLFAPRFFFGCEADDPMNAIAFHRKLNPLGATLGAMLSSDLGHWDTPDLGLILQEAYELVERELITEADFKDFTFAHPARLWGEGNPEFFKGTRVEHEVLKTAISVDNR